MPGFVPYDSEVNALLSQHGDSRPLVSGPSEVYVAETPTHRTISKVGGLLGKVRCQVCPSSAVKGQALADLLRLANWLMSRSQS